MTLTTASSLQVTGVRTVKSRLDWLSWLHNPVSLTAAAWYIFSAVSPLLDTSRHAPGQKRINRGGGDQTLTNNQTHASICPMCVLCEVKVWPSIFVSTAVSAPGRIHSNVLVSPSLHCATTFLYSVSCLQNTVFQSFSLGVLANAITSISSYLKVETTVIITIMKQWTQ